MIMENKNSESENLLAKCIANFGKIIKQPVEFLCEQPTEKCNNIRKFLEEMYEVTIKNDVDNANNVNILPELVVEDMDEEQIWQQLEMRNEHVLNQLNEETAKLLNLPEENLEIRLNEDDEADEENAEDESDENLENGSEEDDDDRDEDEELETEENIDNEENFTKKGKKSIVDDKFFKLSEMTKFLEQEDAKELRKQKGKMLPSDDNNIDYFAEHQTDDDDEDDDGNHAIKYKDFFGDEEDEDDVNNSGTNKGKKDYFADNNGEEEEQADSDGHSQKDDKENSEAEEEDPGDDENEEEEQEQGEEFSRNIEPASDDSESEHEVKDDEIEDKPKSNFEMRQERLNARIKDYEEEVLGEKPWQLKGEIQATNRPQNSLLEEILEFESTIRPAPVITEETTQRLEDIIRQRIKDQAWDDVELKMRPQQTPQEYRKQLVLDQEKSKQSLAQVYESEYQRELDKIDPNREEGTAEEKPEHKEIKRLMNELFIKLDALSNFHFVPKPLAPEAKIVTNTPAVNMEEVAPIAVSDAKLLAPEEIYRGSKHEPMGKSERTRTDKNRERRKKKQKQRAINKVIEIKDIRRQKLGIPLSKKEESAKLMKTITKHRNVEKITASNDKSALKSSKSFFSQLQDQTTKSAKDKNNKMKPGKRTQNESGSKNVSAKKMKL